VALYVVVVGGISVFVPEGETCPIPLSKVTAVALVEVQVNVVDAPRIIAIGCAVTVIVGGAEGVGVGAGCGCGLLLFVELFTPGQEIARKDNMVKKRMIAREVRLAL
jgi:hypothetical protein